VNKIRVLIVDDHAVLRAGLQLLINSQDDMQAVGEASDGMEAVAQVMHLKPDVVILDLEMVGQAGIPTIRQIRNGCPQTRILVLTMYGDHAYLRLALEAGANGYVVKSAAHTELLSATREVAQGKTFVDRSFNPHAVLETIKPKPYKTRETSGSLNLLSPREREVFNFLVQGFTNPQIATQLEISVKSAETYRSRLMDKLNLRNRADVVRFALAHGLLSSAKQQ
jgi:two-component system, NarL family, response regulator NreC